MTARIDPYDQETAAEAYTAEHGAPFNFEPAYVGDGWSAGIAWRAYAYETEHVWDDPEIIDEDGDPDGDPDDEGNYMWDEEGYERPTGRILAYMIGDDRTFAFEPDELTPIGDDDYCPGCGQVGCRAYH